MNTPKSTTRQMCTAVILTSVVSILPVFAFASHIDSDEFHKSIMSGAVIFGALFAAIRGK